MKNKFKYWVEICDEENQVIAHASKEALMEFVEDNAPILCGTIEVPLQTHRRLQKAFKAGYCASSVSWNKYAPQFGFKRLDE